MMLTDRSNPYTPFFRHAPPMNSTQPKKRSVPIEIKNDINCPCNNLFNDTTQKNDGSNSPLLLTLVNEGQASNSIELAPSHIGTDNHEHSQNQGEKRAEEGRRERSGSSVIIDAHLS
jgi:hypothetical protein